MGNVLFARSQLLWRHLHSKGFVHVWTPSWHTGWHCVTERKSKHTVSLTHRCCHYVSVLFTVCNCGPILPFVYVHVQYMYIFTVFMHLYIYRSDFALLLKTRHQGFQVVQNSAEWILYFFNFSSQTIDLCMTDNPWLVALNHQSPWPRFNAISG